MSSLIGVLDYIVIGLMLSVSASIGLYFRFTGGRQKTTDEFLMGSKNMSIWPVAFSLMATYMSAISVLGTPAETYMYGPQYFMWMLGMPVGSLTIAYGLLPVYYDMEISTVYEYLERRFGRSTRTVSSLLFILQMMFYMAVVLYAPSLALNAVTGLSTWASVITLAIICTFYCSLGGLKAVLWTDVFQSFLMYITIIALVVKAAIDLGGMGNLLEIAKDGGRLQFFNTSVDFTERYTLWGAIIMGVVFSFHTFGTNQAQVQRMLSVGNLKKAQISLLLSLPLILIFNLFCYWDGIAIYSYFRGCDPLQQPGVELNSPDQLVPHTIIEMFGHIPGLPGLCIAGVFSASLSTISSAVNSLTAVTMEDFIRPFCFCKRLTESWAAFLAKIIAIVYGAVCLLLTYIVANFRGVLEASGVMFGMIGGPMLGIFSLGMFTTTANEPGTLIGLFVGFAVNAWIGFGSYAANVKILSLPRSIESCPVNLNDTLLYKSTNETSALDTTIDGFIDTFEANDEEERYILPIYKVSYLWFPLIGSLVVILVGYITSFLIGIWKKYPPMDPINYSPFVRKWYFPLTKASSVDKIYPDVELKSTTAINYSASNTNFNILPHEES